MCAYSIHMIMLIDFNRVELDSVLEQDYILQLLGPDLASLAALYSAAILARENRFQVSSCTPR